MRTTSDSLVSSARLVLQAYMAWLAVCLCVLVRPLAAQEPSEALDTKLLEEVVVTAQRREERLQDVPIAVTAISQDTLARRNAVDLSDLLGAVPGLSIAGFTGGNA